MPAITQWVLAFAKAAPYHVLTLGVLIGLIVALWSFRHLDWVQPLFDAVPVAGPLMRWSRMVCFARWMGLLLEQEVALPDALRLTADGAPGPDVRRACRILARRVEAGETLGEALVEGVPLPPTLRPLVVWARQSGSLGSAFRAAAEMYEARTRLHASLLEALLPVLVYLLIAAMTGLIILALFMPLICLIQRLT